MVWRKGLAALALILALTAAAACGQPAAQEPSEPPGGQAPAQQPGEQPAADPGDEPGETYTLRFANFFPEPSGQGKIGAEFAADIERLTGGRVTVEYYAGGTLLGAPDMYDGVVQGIADIGLSNLGYTFGRFKESELLDLPLGFPNAWVANKVVAEFFEEYRPAEFDETVVLTLHASPVNNIITIDRAVQRLEDMQGLELRGTGYIARFVEALGATARPIAMPEAYDNLSRNVIQGLMIPYETVVTFNFGEVTRHITEVWPLGQIYTFYLVMNRDTWDRLPSDIQAVIRDYVDNEFRDKLTAMWNEIDIVGYEYAVDAGYEFHQLNEAELERWQGVADQVIEAYIAEMAAAGHAEDEMRARVEFVRERIAHWTEQQRAAGVKSPTGPDDLRIDG